ncbi:MAG TPA: exodeoxyribonuclease I [Wenzhouxiangellaceae bacterium]|nr:exodeoxyribonuclease I [Wenzhouxiangellaceae bacterium]
MTSETFLWHDYETFGADPRRDRPCQFAALRTDRDLNTIGEPIVWYCQPTDDMLPSPDACLITGITPQTAERLGVPEPEFANRIFELMSEPGTCAVGYNNFRFDDEVSRFLFWRNFIDPYTREFRNGNSRFDLIDLLRMTAALRPEGIQWPLREDGSPSFRLEDLSRANGFSTENAHDALADVENTLGMARRIRQHQPRLWHWGLGLRARHAVEQLVEKREVLLHASSRFPATQGCIAPVLPLFRHPTIKSQWLVWNLREDPTEFFEFDAEMLADLFWTPNADLPDGLKRLPVKWIRTNRSPMLSPTGVLDAAAAERTQIDLDQAAAHALRLAGEPAFIAVLLEMFSSTRSPTSLDADTALYDGFVPDSDRRVAERIRSHSPERAAALLSASPGPFSDERMAELLLHYVGRHAASSLGTPQREAWQAYRRRRLVDDPELGSVQLSGYLARIEQLRRERPDCAALLDELAAWPSRIGIDGL